MPCSVLILTFNEEQNIERCIRSARFSDDVVVFDSQSTDATKELALRSGARFIEHPFQDFGAQREAACRLIDYRHPWVLSLDADERADERLIAEIEQSTASTAQFSAYRIRRKDYFRGRWIKRAMLYPSWQVRLYQHAKVSYRSQSVHEHPEVEGSVGALQGHLLHDNFSKGIAQWWQRHLRYAEFEAQEIEASRRSSARHWRDLLSADPVFRRRALKRLSYQLPFRPELRYAYMMLVRGALLDGPVGWEYCRMIAQYQRITDQIAREVSEQKSR